MELFSSTFRKNQGHPRSTLPKKFSFQSQLTVKNKLFPKNLNLKKHLFTLANFIILYGIFWRCYPFIVSYKIVIIFKLDSAKGLWWWVWSGSDIHLNTLSPLSSTTYKSLNQKVGDNLTRKYNVFQRTFLTWS